ncbi:MAG: glycerol-3-phosphate dehydrogenase/oxidase [Chloroflexi bacterium]|nr:glycerol-3-phosphate dehydrogenase/oxidase [Chloroflexota bacterium]
MERQETLKKITDKPDWSVLIIGGGVNGISTFRDLALQGVDVLLVEKNDFCSGASAASSHMAHGGLRYLENAEFRLVREALRERNRLFINAPHYVHPLPTTIPIFHWFSGTLNAPLKFLGLSNKSSNRGAFIIKVGLTLYDILSRNQRSMPRHKFFGKKESLKKRPQLHPDIVATAQYYDAWIENPERLCVEMILDTEAISDNAHAVNYLGVSDASGETVTLTDELTGDIYTVRPKVVVNAAGPWIDFVNKDIHHKTHFIGGTKGSHLVINHPDLLKASAGSEMFFENKDGRITLFLPYLGKIMAGTTDIPINNPDDARCTEEEVDYILESIRQVFPEIDVNRSHIVFRFSGVRPLPASDASNPSQISRDHSINVIEPDDVVDFPTYSLVGGKWTTFRAFGEQVTDTVLDKLNMSRSGDTKSMAIGGGKDYPTENKSQWLEQTNEQIGVAKDQLETLFNRYGTRAKDVAQYIAAGDDSALETLSDFTEREIEFIARHEKVVRLDDFFLRRSLLAITGHVTRPMIEEVTEILGRVLGWSADRQHQEIKRTAELLSEQHAMKL